MGKLYGFLNHAFSSESLAVSSIREQKSCKAFLSGSLSLAIAKGEILGLILLGFKHF